MSGVDSRFNEVACPAAEELYLFFLEQLLAEKGQAFPEPERVTAAQPSGRTA